MAVNVTLSDLRTEILLRIDDAASGFFSTSEVNRLINKSGSRLITKLVSQHGIRYRQCRGTFTTSAGSLRYTYPTSDTWSGDTGLSLLQLLGATAVFSDTQNQRLVRLEWNERSAFQNRNATWSYGSLLGYQTDPLAIFLFPTPTAATLIEIIYVPAWKALSADGDTFNGINGFEEYIVSDVCAQLAAREEDDANVAFHRSERDLVWADILALASSSDSAEAPGPVDLEGWRRDGIDDWTVRDY